MARNADRRTGGNPHLSPPARRRRKEDLLTRAIPSQARGIADAIVIKDEDLFFLCEPDGGVPAGGQHGYGLYLHDCRFLNRYQLTIDGQPAEPLVASSIGGYSAIFELANPDLRLGHQFIPKQRVGIKWERVVAAPQLALEDCLTFTNYGLEPVQLPFELAFDAAFEDIFTIRGFMTGKRGRVHRPAWRGRVLGFVYEGADGVFRSVHLHFSRAVARKHGASAQFRLRIAPRQSERLHISVTVAEGRSLSAVRRETHSRRDLSQIRGQLQRRADAWVRQHTEVRSGSRVLNAAVDRSLRDLRVLRSRLEHREFFAAGTPWFATLFGRDSIITALEMLAFDSSIAEQTLRLLAEFQGHREDQWRDEQPGKILHELRVGELAHLGEIPHTPYYGTIDATPLFLILVGLHARWTGSLGLFRELRDNIDLALEWIRHYGDLNGDGYLEYQSKSHQGLVNQGWKDSGDAISNADGSLAEPPLALVEVQGYVYWAKKEMAELFRRAGEATMASRLERAADALRPRFNRDFWLPGWGIYALALEARHRPATVVSSNPGQALWAGIADPKKARRTMQRLLRPDMFTGWGIRTLSSQAARYNPIGYHTGTVWPHDNALIAAGFRNYGLDAAARRIFTALLEASVHFPEHRMPEAFAGLPRGEYGVPVNYPVACHPQAWAAGAFPYLLQTALGLVPEAFGNRLRIVRPILPEMVPWVELSHLQVGKAHVDLRFEQRDDGSVSVEVLKRTHNLEVVVEPESAARVPHPGPVLARVGSSAGERARNRKGERVA